jgi:hypothetical protein
MRVLVTLFATILALAVTTNTVLAASTEQTISFRTSAQYNSIFGGFDTGTATFSGSLGGSDISRLRGTIDLGVSSYNLTIDPSGLAQVGNQDLQVGWQQLVCGQFFCEWIFGQATYTRRVGSVPADVRFGQLRGSGTLNWASDATCVASCPPPGAFIYFNLMGYSNLSAAVTSKDEAGMLNLYGPAPSIQ